MDYAEQKPRYMALVSARRVDGPTAVLNRSTGSAIPN